jgi:hypothetical protein
MCETTLDPSATVGTATPVVQTPASEGPPTIGEIFRQYGLAYREKHSRRMSRDQAKVLAMLEACRSGELGMVRFYCPNCEQHHLMPRSCGNRHCPLCEGHKARQWLKSQLE